MSDAISNTQEEWRAIPGFNGKYLASSLGRIYSTWSGRGRHPKIRKPSTSAMGYLVIELFAGDGTRFRTSVHWLVLRTFSGPPPPKQEPNHKNGNRKDKRADNLEWVTRSQNILHSFRVLNRGHANCKGENNPMAVLTDLKVRKFRAQYRSGRSTRSIANEMGMTWEAVRYMLLGRTWKHIV